MSQFAIRGGRAIPSVAPVPVIGQYFMPVSLTGGVTRGLLALASVFISCCVGILFGIRGLRARRRVSARSFKRHVTQRKQ